MTISGIQTGNPYLSQQQPIYARKSQNNHSAKKDVVKISHEAQQLSKQAPNNEDEALKKYSLPDWFADMMPDIFFLDGEAMSSEIAHFGETKERVQTSFWLPSTKDDEAGELCDKLLDCFQKELRVNNINGSDEYYQSVIKDKQTSEKIHQGVKERITNDPRAMELFKMFDISL